MEADWTAAIELLSQRVQQFEHKIESEGNKILQSEADNLKTIQQLQATIESEVSKRIQIEEELKKLREHLPRRHSYLRNGDLEKVNGSSGGVNRKPSDNEMIINNEKGEFERRDSSTAFGYRAVDLTQGTGGAPNSNSTIIININTNPVTGQPQAQQQQQQTPQLKQPQTTTSSTAPSSSTSSGKERTNSSTSTIKQEPSFTDPATTSPTPSSSITTKDNKEKEREHNKDSKDNKGPNTAADDKARAEWVKAPLPVTSMHLHFVVYVFNLNLL